MESNEIESDDNLRAALAAAREALQRESAEVAPSPDVANRLHAAMERSHGRGRLHGSRDRTGGVGGWLSGYRISVWQGGVASLLGAAIVLLATRSGGDAQLRIVYVPQVVSAAAAPVARVDTEAIVRRVVDSLKEEIHREVRTASHQAIYTATRPRRLEHRDETPNRMPATIRSSGTKKNLENAFVGLANLAQVEHQRSGRNIGEDSAFAKFSVSVSREN